jgi:hypothetical protein
MIAPPPAIGAYGNRKSAHQYDRPAPPGHPADALMPSGPRSFSVMESRPSPALPESVEPVTSLAEDLPELYRTILERVEQLERIGARREAASVRAAATRAYSEAWDESARRMLSNLLTRANRGLAGPERSRGWSLRRRSLPAR